VLTGLLSCVAAGFSDSVVRVYNLEQMGNARSKLPKYHKQQLQSAKRQRGAAGELEPGIDVDTEMAELQVLIQFNTPCLRTGFPPQPSVAVACVNLTHRLLR
jgi:hypothetical protein